MQLAFDVKKDLRRFLAVAGVSLALVIGTTPAAFAVSRDSDHDGLSNYQERNVTETKPFDSDSDNARIKDGNEDDDCDEIEDEDDEDDDNDGESDDEDEDN